MGVQKQSYHIQRVQSVIQAALAHILSREIDTSGFGLITVSQVRVSKDMSYADIYIIGHDESKKEALITFLKSEAKQIRHVLSQQVKLRKTPELKFHYDDVQVQGMRINELLSKD